MRGRSSHTNKTSDRRLSLPSINDYDFTRRMDIDAPRPRCPFCGLPMRFRFSELSAFQTFDCKGCQVVLNIPSQAGVSGIAASVAARG
jgi:transposase-like protein